MSGVPVDPVYGDGPLPGECPYTGASTPTCTTPGFVIDTRNVPTIPPGRPWGTENANNIGPDPSSGPTPNRHLLSFPTRPAIPRKGSAPTT